MSFNDGPVHMLVGLQFNTEKFLNVEKFGDQVSAVAPALKQKQTFNVEVENGWYYFRTWTGKYLAADELGKVTASSESKGTDEGFAVEFGWGPVYIRSAHGKYLVPQEDTVAAVGAAADESSVVHMMFAIHPQVCLQTFEGRYMMIEADDEATVVSPNHYQAGVGTLITLVYVANGQYALWSGLNGKFIQCDDNGDLAAVGAAAEQNCCFVFEWVEDRLAIKSVSNGKYLTVEGRKGELRAKRDKIAQREKFVMHDSHAQVTLLAHNNKFVGHQETTVICTKDKAKDREIFIMETEGDRVALRSSGADYICHANNGITADGSARDDSTLWECEFPARGRVAFKNSDGKYLATKALGGVYLAGAPDAEAQFTVQLLNRPVIALKSAFQTFVGSMNGKLVTHKATVETFSLEFENGLYAFQNAEGQYFQTSGEEIVPGQRELFELHYHPNSRVALKNQAGKFLGAEQHGGFIAKATEAGKNELWEI